MLLVFKILAKKFSITAKKSPQFITSRMPIRNFLPFISLRFTNQKVTN